jgi:hypothetical protein
MVRPVEFHRMEFVESPNSSARPSGRARVLVFRKNFSSSLILVFEVIIESSRDHLR